MLNWSLVLVVPIQLILGVNMKLSEVIKEFENGKTIVRKHAGLRFYYKLINVSKGIDRCASWVDKDKLNFDDRVVIHLNDEYEVAEE